MSNEPDVKELFEAFVYFRRQGASPDYALQELRQMKPIISPEERDELARMVRNWESLEGQRYRPSADAQVEPLPAYHDTSELSGIECPNCDSINRLDASYCYSCGEVLISYGGTRQLMTVEDDASLPESYRCIFLVKGYEDHPIEVQVDQSSEVILGRSAADNPIVPDIDLTPYEGSKHGVSRVHATIKYTDQVLTVSDMGSVNRTFINSEALHPQEVRVLRDGDELRLGRLAMRVSFQQPLKRIRR